METRFKGQILNRVYRVWLVRKFLPVFVLEAVLFTAVLYSLGRAVFVQRILENATNTLFSNPTGIFVFVASAFGNASFAVKVLTLVAAILFALAIRQLTQGVLRLILVKENYFSRVQSK